MTRDDSDLTVSARDDDLNFEGNVRPKSCRIILVRIMCMISLVYF